jgi:hypothetical protein
MAASESPRKVDENTTNLRTAAATAIPRTPIASVDVSRGNSPLQCRLTKSIEEAPGSSQVICASARSTAIVAIASTAIATVRNSLFDVAKTRLPVA